MKVPFLNLKRNYQVIQKEIDKSIEKVVKSGNYILGNEVENFESAYAKFCNVNFCVGVANGLEALQIALTALGIGKGDEVIVPSHTFIATWLAVSHVGAIPVPIEPDLNTYNIDPKFIERKINKKTKAIIMVHLYGQPADIDSIMSIAKKKNLYVIEDAAQSQGASYKNEMIGSHGDIVAWSFYPGKNLGAFGDAGALTTKSKKLYEKIKILRNYGSKEKYVNNLIGFNSRIDPIQAAILSVKLKFLKKTNILRRNIAKKYIDAIEPLCILPSEDKLSEHVWHLFVIRHEKRDKLKDKLDIYGISTLIHYPIPPHLQQAYSFLNLRKGSLPIAEKICSEVISLPLDPYMNNNEIDYVIDKTNQVLKKIGK